MARLSPTPIFRAFDQNGDPLSGGKLYTYEAGTSTPKVTYTDESEVTANTNPVILDSEGYANVWLESGAYKFVLDSATDVNQWTVDDIIGSGGGGFLGSVSNESANFNLTTAYEGFLVNATDSITISLLEASTAKDGFTFTVKNSATGDVTIDPFGAETIDGTATRVLTVGSSITVTCDGTNWVTSGNALTEGLDVVEETGTSFTLSFNTHAGRVVHANNASDITVTLPQVSTENVGDGFNCIVRKQGAGDVTFVTEGADTLESTASLDKLITQYKHALIYKSDSTTWNIEGAEAIA